MTANWENRTLFHGDNLKILRAMNSASVDLIATDPPFKKGRDFHATPDSLAEGASFQDRWSWERDVHQDWVDKIKDDFPAVWEVIDAANAVYIRKTKKNLKRPREEVGSDMGAFLCFMAVRLLEMHRVLKSTGSIFLHCDPTASHYLKELLDAVFDWGNFVNEIVWCYIDPAGRRNSDFYKRTHDLIFWYAKNSKLCRVGTIAQNPLSASTIKRYAPYFDIQGQITYRRLKETNPGVFKALKAIPDDLDMVWVDRNKGTTMGDWWEGIRPIKRKGGKQKQKEAFRYPTQKPLALYKRVIATASRKGNVVLDPFCGCATTLAAAEDLDRQWVGIDIWDQAHEVVLDRFRKEGLAAKGHAGDHLTFGHVHYRTGLPERTDDGQIAAPYLKVKEGQQYPKESSMQRSAMYAQLLVERGRKCQGCDRTFDDPRYLELDHKMPRSEGGSNELYNRILLCGPCNRLKSNTLTLTGLRRQNKKQGYMAGTEGDHPLMKKYRESHRTAPRSLFE